MLLNFLFQLKLSYATLIEDLLSSEIYNQERKKFSEKKRF